jgi:hypothetical protein
LTLHLKLRSGLSFVERIDWLESSKISTFARGTSSRYSSALDAHGFGGLATGVGFTPPLND